jgi:hypothetical protein
MICYCRYGEQRLWASVGWGGMAAVAGYLIGNFIIFFIVPVLSGTLYFN